MKSALVFGLTAFAAATVCEKGVEECQQMQPYFDPNLPVLVDGDNLTDNWLNSSMRELQPSGHVLYAKKRYCGKSGYQGENRGGLDYTRDQCLLQNSRYNKGYVGYWWKSWGGGYGGCCSDISSLTTNWPDASTYSLVVKGIESPATAGEPGVYIGPAKEEENPAAAFIGLICCCACYGLIGYGIRKICCGGSSESVASATERDVELQKQPPPSEPPIMGQPMQHPPQMMPQQQPMYQQQMMPQQQQPMYQQQPQQMYQQQPMPYGGQAMQQPGMIPPGQPQQMMPPGQPYPQQPMVYAPQPMGMQQQQQQVTTTTTTTTNQMGMQQF